MAIKRSSHGEVTPRSPRGAGDARRFAPEATCHSYSHHWLCRSHALLLFACPCRCPPDPRAPPSPLQETLAVPSALHQRVVLGSWCGVVRARSLVRPVKGIESQNVVQPAKAAEDSQPGTTCGGC